MALIAIGNPPIVINTLKYKLQERKMKIKNNNILYQIASAQQIAHWLNVFFGFLWVKQFLKYHLWEKVATFLHIHRLSDIQF